MGSFLPSDIARLVLGYLKENGFFETYSMFLNECSFLKDYLTLLQEQKEYSTSIGGKSLTNILQEYDQIMTQDTLGSSNIMRLWAKFDALVIQLKRVMRQVSGSGNSHCTPVVNCVLNRPTIRLRKRNMQQHIVEVSKNESAKNEVTCNLLAANKKLSHTVVRTPLQVNSVVDTNTSQGDDSSYKKLSTDITRSLKGTIVKNKIKNSKKSFSFLPFDSGKNEQVNTSIFLQQINRNQSENSNPSIILHPISNTLNQQTNTSFVLHSINSNQNISQNPVSVQIKPSIGPNIPPHTLSSSQIQVVVLKSPITLTHQPDQSQLMHLKIKDQSLPVNDIHIVNTTQQVSTVCSSTTTTTSAPSPTYKQIDQNLNSSEQNNKDFRSPRRKRHAPKKRQETPNIKTKSSEVMDVSEDSVDISQFMEQLLNNTALHEKLAENINKIVSNELPAQVVENQIEESADNSQSINGNDPEKRSFEKDGSNHSDPDSFLHETIMSEDAIRGIVEMTESDPAFEALLNLFNLDRQDLEKHIPVQSPLDMQEKESNKLQSDLFLRDNSKTHFQDADVTELKIPDQYECLQSFGNTNLSTEINNLSDSFHFPDGFNISPFLSSTPAITSFDETAKSQKISVVKNSKFPINFSIGSLKPTNESKNESLGTSSPKDFLGGTSLEVKSSGLSYIFGKGKIESLSKSFTIQNAKPISDDKVQQSDLIKKPSLLNKSFRIEPSDKQTHVRVLNFDVQTSKEGKDNTNELSYSQISEQSLPIINLSKLQCSSDFPAEIKKSNPHLTSKKRLISDGNYTAASNETVAVEKNQELLPHASIIKKDILVCDQETPPGSITDSSISPEIQPFGESPHSDAEGNKKRKRKMKSQEMLSKMNVDKFLAQLYGD